MSSYPFPDTWIHSWTWKGLSVSTLNAPPIAAVSSETASFDECNESQAIPLVLIHGFGACKEHWRHNIEPLRAHRHVYALDLIGFGQSDKPRSSLKGEQLDESSICYSIDLWAEQVSDFIIDSIGCSVILVGNSIGGVVALEAAKRLEQASTPANRVILIDCAQRALDDKFLAEQPPLRKWGRPLLKSLVRQRWLTSSLFRAVAKPNIIRAILKQAYPSGKNVDDELIEILLKPALQPGADESFRGFINLFNDKTAPEVLAHLNTPVSIIWGEDDPWEPVAKAKAWQDYACVQDFQQLKDLGHCPHDEAPDLVNKMILAIIEGQQP